MARSTAGCHGPSRPPARGRRERHSGTAGAARHRPAAPWLGERSVDRGTPDPDCPHPAPTVACILFAPPPGVAALTDADPCSAPASASAAARPRRKRSRWTTLWELTTLTQDTSHSHVALLRTSPIPGREPVREGIKRHPRSAATRLGRVVKRQPEPLEPRSASARGRFCLYIQLDTTRTTRSGNTVPIDDQGRASRPTRVVTSDQIRPAYAQLLPRCERVSFTRDPTVTGTCLRPGNFTFVLRQRARGAMEVERA
jgi:hypothetical protein